MFDDNSTQIILAVLSLIGMLITGMFSFLSLRFAAQARNNAAQAVQSSQANAVKLTEVAEAVDGLTHARIEAEARIGEANVATARLEGKIEGQSVERDRPPDHPAIAAPASATVTAPADAGLIATATVSAAPPTKVELVKSIVLDINDPKQPKK